MSYLNDFMPKITIPWLTFPVVLVLQPIGAAAQDDSRPTPAPIEQLSAWSGQLHSPYSVNVTVEVTELDDTSTPTGEEVRATVDSWIRTLEGPGGEVAFDAALRSYLGWIGPTALPPGKGLHISRIHHRTNGERILDVREEEPNFTSARLLAGGWSVHYSSGLARVLIEEETPVFHRYLFDLTRLFYPLGIDAASRSWYSQSRWEHHAIAPSSWWLKRKEEEGVPGTLLMYGRTSRPIPQCVLKKVTEDGKDLYVLALYRGAWIERNGQHFPFVSEVLMFDTLAVAGKMELRRTLVGDVSFHEQLDIRLPVPFEGIEGMQDARGGQTRTYGPDLTSWPVDVLDLISGDE